MAVTPNSIVTPQAPRSASVVATTANTDYADTAANAVALITAGSNGARVTKLYAIPRATVTPTQLQAFRSGNGTTNRRFFASKLMAAYTMAQTTECPTTDFGYSEDNPLILNGGENLWVAVGVTSSAGVAFHIEYADY